MRDLLLILDYDHLAARIAVRKLRAERVCCRIVPADISGERLAQEDPRGLLLCAASDTPPMSLSPAVLAFPGPVLALGATAPALNAAMGGENGVYTPMNALDEIDYSECPLLDGLTSGQRLIKGLTPMRLPRDAQIIAALGDARMPIAFSNGASRRFGLQIEAEAHDPDSTRLLKNFALSVCGCTPWWDDEAFVRESTDEIRRAAGDGNAVCLLTGGLYSNVAALLAARALGERLTCIFVDTGLTQDDQEHQFFEYFTSRTGLTIRREDCRERFLAALKGVRDTMDKRRTVESMLTVIRRDVQRSLPQLNAIIRGRSFIERLTEGEEVAGIRAGVLCVEPLKDLFMLEVRQIGRFLGMPEDILYRQAIPATGLALNISGEVTAERLALLGCADRIYRRTLAENNQHRRLNAYFASLIPDGAGYIVSLRADTVSDTGISRASRVPYDLLENVVEQICHECPQVTRVVYDLTPRHLV